jgi:hypothetical protein
MRGRGLNLCGSDRGKLKAIVNAVMNFGFFKSRGVSRLAAELLACKEGSSLLDKL